MFTLKQEIELIKTIRYWEKVRKRAEKKIESLNKVLKIKRGGTT
jgi:hypothetical protein|tara:strand:- start:287 stop:418 length:132 start_codon:yes stop_codon:yes gene_type:complete